MRVALVSEHASPLAALGGTDAGGQNVHVGALARELAQQAQSVVVHTRRDDPAVARQVPADGGVVVDHVDAGPPIPIPKDELLGWMGDFGAELGERWAKDPPDVVHAHFWMSGLASLQAARPLGIPVVLTYHALGAVKRRHQGDADTSPAQRLDIERWLLAEVDHVIATTADEVSELARLGPPPRGVSIIPCGVDLELFRPAGPVMLRAATRRVAVVGRLVERKGVADVVEALRWLPDTELVVAGGPAADALDADPEVGRLRALASRFGVDERVQFLGRVSRDELPALLRSSDAVVSVPYYEPFGMVPLEAMACGVPPVVSAVGGLKESVVDGVTGVHVPPGDPRTLAEGITRLFEDPDRARRLGAAGSRRVRTNYGWPRVAARTIDVYDRVTAAPRPPAHDEASYLSGVPSR